MKQRNLKLISLLISLVLSLIIFTSCTPPVFYLEYDKSADIVSVEIVKYNNTDLIRTDVEKDIKNYNFDYEEKLFSVAEETAKALIEDLNYVTFNKYRNNIPVEPADVCIKLINSDNSFYIIYCTVENYYEGSNNKIYPNMYSGIFKYSAAGDCVSHYTDISYEQQYILLLYKYFNNDLADYISSLNTY